MLIISNWTLASCSSDFEIITCVFTPRIVLHSVQLLILIIIIIIIIITIIIIIIIIIIIAVVIDIVVVTYLHI